MKPENYDQSPTPNRTASQRHSIHITTVRIYGDDMNVIIIANSSLFF
jgi:hypothetical protein